MLIASTQTHVSGCTPHWSCLFSALYTEISPGLEHWSTGALEHWSTGALEHWDTGTLGHWDTGTLEHWSTGDRLTADTHLTLSGAENHINPKTQVE